MEGQIFCEFGGFENLSYPEAAPLCGLLLWYSTSSTVQTAPLTFSTRMKHLCRDKLWRTAFLSKEGTNYQFAPIFSDPDFSFEKSFFKLTIFSGLRKEVFIFVQVFYNLLNKSVHSKNCTKVKTFFGMPQKIVNFQKLWFFSTKIRIWQKCNFNVQKPQIL